MKAEDVLNRLIEGNATYVRSGRYAADVTAERRDRLAAEQRPMAVVVACSDSRVVPEVVFGASLGELFVIRVAGNVLADAELASIEYAVHHLDVGVVVILGHTACGAISAAVAGEEAGLVSAITTPLRKIIAGEQDVTAAALRNVRHQVRLVRAHWPDPSVYSCGAIYDIATGKVRFIQE